MVTQITHVNQVHRSVAENLGRLEDAALFAITPEAMALITAAVSLHRLCIDDRATIEALKNEATTAIMKVIEHNLHWQTPALHGISTMFRGGNPDHLRRAMKRYLDRWVETEALELARKAAAVAIVVINWKEACLSPPTAQTDALLSGYHDEVQKLQTEIDQAVTALIEFGQA